METKAIEISSAAINSETQSGFLDPNASPISKLHRDILLYIFQYNANMDEDLQRGAGDWSVLKESSRAIDTARNSSQVNTLWRNIILNSPRVWADLIDLDALEDSGENWREEIIQRSQKCSLHVKGSVSLEDIGGLEPWWLRFFNVNWTRIRNLELLIRFGDHAPDEYAEFYVVDYPEATVYQRALPFIAQSTSTLESFRLVLPYLCDPLEHGATLFNNNAPSLQRFDCQNLRFNTENSWISQLRTLHVHQYRQPHGLVFKPATLYQILSWAPFLESLSIDEAIGMTPKIDFRQVAIHLPQLRHLDLRSMGVCGPDIPHGTSPYWDLLNIIIPRPDCSIHAVLYLPDSHDTVDTVIQVLSRFMSNYFQVCNPAYLELSADAVRFRLTDLRNPPRLFNDRTIPKLPFLNYSFSGRGFFTQSTFSGIFKTLSNASLLSVVDLRLQFGNSMRDLLLYPQFRPFLLSFSSVETFTTTLCTLQYLSASPMVDFVMVFPQLKVLKMLFGTLGYDYVPDTETPISDILTSFLTARKKAGVPVLELEYLCLPFEEQMEDLTFLEDVAGLKVFWNIELIGDGEYVCGSGRPEELHFGRKWKLGRLRKYGI